MTSSARSLPEATARTTNRAAASAASSRDGLRPRSQATAAAPATPWTAPAGASGVSSARTLPSAWSGLAEADDGEGVVGVQPAGLPELAREAGVRGVQPEGDRAVLRHVLHRGAGADVQPVERLLHAREGLRLHGPQQVRRAVQALPGEHAVGRGRGHEGRDAGAS